MKKYLVFVLAALLTLGLGSVALAVTEASDTVTVTVNSIETLVVPSTTGVTLSAVDAEDPTKYTQATATDIGGLEYSHNTANKEITALAVADTGNATNDITLTVKIEGQETAATIVNEGTDVSGGAVCWTDIAAGSYTLDLDWTADATLAGTLADDYVWTVTFTTADAA